MTEHERFVQLATEFTAALALLTVELHRTRAAMDSFADACCLASQQGAAAAREADETIAKARTP